MTYLLRAVLALRALAGLAPAAFAQHPDAARRRRCGGWKPMAIAVQTDLGFILPARIRGFERRGFTSTRGRRRQRAWRIMRARTASSSASSWTLRGDVRGVPMPGADGVARNWSREARRRASSTPPASPRETLLEGPLIWNNAPRPNGMMLFRRFGPASAARSRASGTAISASGR